MTKMLIIPFILFFLATASSLSNANEAKNTRDHELSKHRQADQQVRKHAHSHDSKQKSKYDLRDLDGKQKRDGHVHGHKHGHKDGHKHDHKAVNKTDLQGKGSHDHGESHKHDHGDAHQSQGDGHGAHYGHGHERHGHGEGHGGHEHGYDRLWDVGVSG